MTKAENMSKQGHKKTLSPYLRSQGSDVNADVHFICLDDHIDSCAEGRQMWVYSDSESIYQQSNL